MVLKFTPQLHFHLDEAIERGTKVMEIMRQIDDIVPPAEEDDTRMDEEEPIGNSEELVRFEEEEDEQGPAGETPARGDGSRSPPSLAAGARKTPRA